MVSLLYQNTHCVFVTHGENIISQATGPKFLVGANDFDKSVDTQRSASILEQKEKAI